MWAEWKNKYMKADFSSILATQNQKTPHTHLLTWFVVPARRLPMVFSVFIPSSFGEKGSSSTCDHYARIWTQTPIDTFPIILPTYNGSHFAGVAVVIFRACYCLWLCHLGSAKASASDQQPFRELLSDQSVALTRHLLWAPHPYVTQTWHKPHRELQHAPRVPHNSPLLWFFMEGNFKSRLPTLMSSHKCAWESKIHKPSKRLSEITEGSNNQENKNI